MMKVRFWGTRGSIPVSLTSAQLQHKLRAVLRGATGVDLTSDAALTAYLDGLGFDLAGTFGGHTSCVQLETRGGENIFLDFGSGARPLGGHFLGRFGPAKPQTYHVFMSHLHIDHILGFPFFTPIYIPGNRLIIHTCHPNAEIAFRRQQSAPLFPVEFDQLGARIEFNLLQAGQTYDIAGMQVSTHRQLHAGDSFGWRFQCDGKTLVYSTDSEHKLDDDQQRADFVQFFKAADLVIFDAMYSLADAVTVKADWGHSSNIVGVELCQMAGAKRICLYHHEPAYDDSQILGVLNDTIRFEQITRHGPPLGIVSAYDGLELEI
jgi:phosphoribosyl 1,2-cyclic phosphodiesterase